LKYLRLKFEKWTEDIVLHFNETGFWKMIFDIYQILFWYFKTHCRKYFILIKLRYSTQMIMNCNCYRKATARSADHPVIWRRIQEELTRTTFKYIILGSEYLWIGQGDILQKQTKDETSKKTVRKLLIFLTSMKL